MINQKFIIGSLAGMGFFLGSNSTQVVAQMTHEEISPSGTELKNQFQKVEQPLWLKSAVTVGGLGLIGLELWWFLLSKPRSQKAETKQGIQEVTITVDGGYEPNQVVVNVGQPVRLNFYRKDPSSCLEEVRFPDFQIAQELTLNQITPIEFTPKQAGIYTFSCGMNMFRGQVKVEAELTQKTSENTIIAETPSQLITTSTNNHTTAVVQATKPIVEQGIQKVTITVDKGYTPNHIVVKAGQPVQLNFFRQDPNGCLSKVLIPEFDISSDLPLNQTTTIELTPSKTGEYSFTCGMNMYRGVLEVQA